MTKTYFISGHLDLTKAEFNEHYKPRIDAAIADGAKFVVCDAPGADTMAQEYLITAGVSITIFHKGEARHVMNGVQMCGGFTSNTTRDKAATAASTDDIAWVRPQTPDMVERLKISLAAQGRKYNPNRVSGTEKNLLRRAAMKHN